MGSDFGEGRSAAKSFDRRRQAIVDVEDEFDGTVSDLSTRTCFCHRLHIASDADTSGRQGNTDTLNVNERLSDTVKIQHCKSEKFLFATTTTHANPLQWRNLSSVDQAEATWFNFYVTTYKCPVQQKIVVTLQTNNDRKFVCVDAGAAVIVVKSLKPDDDNVEVLHVESDGRYFYQTDVVRHVVNNSGSGDQPPARYRSTVDSYYLALIDEESELSLKQVGTASECEIQFKKGE